MKKKSTSGHRGELLQRIVKENGISITLLVKRAGYKNRASFYNHIDNPKLSYEILVKYGKVLHYNFAEDIEGVLAFSTNEPGVDYEKKPITLEQAIKIIDELKEAHYKLLIKYQALLEKGK